MDLGLVFQLLSPSDLVFKAQLSNSFDCPLSWLLFAGLDQIIINGPLSGGLLILGSSSSFQSIWHPLGLVSLLITLICLSGSLYVWAMISPAETMQTMPFFWLAMLITFALVAIAGQLSLSRLASQMELAKNRAGAKPGVTA